MASSILVIILTILAEVCTKALCLSDDYEDWKPDFDKSAGEWVIIIHYKVYLSGVLDLSCWNLGLWSMM